jgi:hypothetical protein
VAAGAAASRELAAAAKLGRELGLGAYEARGIDEGRTPRELGGGG